MARVSEGVVLFGTWAKQRRLTLDLTQGALAKRIGCAIATLQKIEQGARTPSEQIAGLLAQALNIPDADVPAVVAAARSGVAPVFREPAPDIIRLDDLIGRDAQLAALAALIRARRQRVITLTGPGGIGKTSLALALAHALAGEFEHGTRIVSLADVRSPELVAGVTAASLIPDAQTGSLSALLNALRARKQLVVFDNFEHVLPAAEIIDRIARAAPDIVIVATSREPLNAAGEHIVPIQPLAHADASALFARHARLAAPRWQPGPGDANAIGALCRAFDNLPLAIKLCAARTTVMPPPALLKRLVSEQGLPRIEFAADGLSDLPLRHHSLDDTIRWSYDLLAPDERRAFQRMAVFMGGCDLPAAEAVLASDNAALPIDAWNALTSLIQKSLLTRGDSPEGADTRFATLETLRAFAARRAMRDGSWSAIQDAHLRYYTALAEANECLTPFNTRVRAQEREAPNFYAALSHAWRTDAATGMRLFRALIKFWRARLRFTDQLALASEGLALAPADAALFRGELHMQAASACIALETIDEAADHLARASALLEAHAGAALLWRVRDLQGLTAQRRGDLKLALRLHREALDLASKHNTQVERARTRLHIGRAAAMIGDFDEAESVLLQVCDALPPDDENNLLARLLLAKTQMMLGKLGECEALLSHCQTLIASFRLFDWSGSIHMAFSDLAYLRGNVDDAMREAERARAEYAAISDKTPAPARCDRVRALLKIDRGDIDAGIPLLRESLAEEKFADDSVAGLAALAGFALWHAQNERREAAAAAFARIARAFKDTDLARRVYVDASPTELEFARRALQRASAAPSNVAPAVALDTAVRAAMQP